MASELDIKVKQEFYKMKEGEREGIWIESLTQVKARKSQAYKINDKLFKKIVNVKLDNCPELDDL